MMDLEIIQHHQRQVLEAFRCGEFDQIEIIGEADEKEFFELCLKERILEALAESMPTARKKQEVPRWFILAANLSLKLHLENSFLALERVVQCGGLLSALDPAIASKHLDPKSQEILIKCNGFNDKNHYPRKTPCDQDTLRKAVKDVSAECWMNWFNGPVQKTFQAYGFYDSEGIFVGDASYLFVPNNPQYEGSVLMWFDEHNHPVDYEKLTADQRKRAHLERCYKMVSLIHVRAECYVYVAVAVVPGNEHESGLLYRMVEQFVKVAGKGMIKLLILDRGFVDGLNISRCKEQFDIDVLIPAKKNMDIWQDAWDLGKTQPWQKIRVQEPAPKNPPANRPEAIRQRERKRQETLAAKRPAADPAQVLTQTELCLIKGFTSWSQATVPINVLLIQERYADGHAKDWALMSSRNYTDPVQMKAHYGQRNKIEERHRVLKCFHDLSDFSSTRFNVIVAQVVFILLSYTLRQWQLWKLHQEELAGRTPGLIHHGLNMRKEYVVIYLAHAYARMPLVRFTREVLELEPEARAKALVRIRKLEQSLLSPFDDTS